MAVGKNKRFNKKGKIGKKKKADAFLKKEWFRLRIPTFGILHQEKYGWTCANKTQHGTTVESRLYNRVCTIRCGDLQRDPKADNSEQISIATNLKFRIAKTENQECFVDFHGLELTRDKTCSMLKKWVTLIEAQVDIKTTDGFVFRVFAMALTKQQPHQMKTTSYAKSSQVRAIRVKMQEVMKEQLSDKNTRELWSDLLVDNKLTNAFVKECSKIFPIDNQPSSAPCIRKVKLIKRPVSEDLRRIDDLHRVQEEVEEIDETAI